MKFLPPILAWLTLAATCLAELTILAPPDFVVVGQPIKVFVTGIAEKTIPTAFEHFPRVGTTFEPARTLDGSAVFAWFLAKLPGEYLIFVVADGEYAEETIVVGGPQPDPFPDPRPDPRPIPIPSDQLSVTIIYESQTRTSQEILALSKIRAYASQERLVMRLEDKDLVDGSTNKPPAWFVPYLAAMQAAKVVVPSILLHDARSGRIVAVEPLTTGDAAIALVESFTKGNP